MDEKKFLRQEFTVSEDSLAVNVGSGSLRVLATPCVTAWAENTAMHLAEKYTDDGVTTVGTRIELEHISATPINAEVYVEAELINIDGRKYEFEVRAYDAKGIIAKGSHTRYAVYAEKFQNKADTKLKGEADD